LFTHRLMSVTMLSVLGSATLAWRRSSAISLV
jgi:hypothetical protein